MDRGADRPQRLQESDMLKQLSTLSCTYAYNITKYIVIFLALQREYEYYTCKRSSSHFTSSWESLFYRGLTSTTKGFEFKFRLNNND